MIWTVIPAMQMDALGSGLYSTLTLLFTDRVVFEGNESISSFSPESKRIINEHPSRPVKSFTVPVASMPELFFVHPATKKIAKNKMRQILFIMSFSTDNELKKNVAYLLLIATTGFNLAAIIAGIIPASMPTTKQMPIAQIRFAVEI